MGDQRVETRRTERRWLEAGAVATWLVCLVPGVAGIAQGELYGWPAIVFFGAYLLYGAAMIAVMYEPEFLAVTRGGCRALLGVQAGTATIALTTAGMYTRDTGPLPALVVITAAQLPYLMPFRTAWLWVCGQTLVLGGIIRFIGEDWPDVVGVALSLGGFQAFALISSYFTMQERAAREELARAHDALQAAQARLAETSRAEERLRISRDLHDTLGHHLTALSLQLDVASRLSDGKAADHVRQAHAITRLLLSDVRDVVSTLREVRPVDLAENIRALARVTSGLAVHIEMPPTLDVADPERAQALLRCVQEIITNAARHAQAQNLWVRLEPRADGIALHARDDGRGVPQLSLGHGLTGMRERFAAFAGSVEFTTRAGTGFEVRGFLPTPHTAT